MVTKVIDFLIQLKIFYSATSIYQLLIKFSYKKKIMNEKISFFSLSLFEINILANLICIQKSFKFVFLNMVFMAL